MDDIRKTIQAFGCSKFAPMEDFAEGKVIIQFEYRGRMVQVSASAKGYAAAWLKENPYSSRMRMTKVEHERRALEKGQIAVWSILRDWIKGQLTAVETGILSFDAAFLGQILLPTGETVHDRIASHGLLAAPDEKKP
ncbi:hypothetical protein GOB36_26590 [Sinorhizobium meliloti]|uniref:hypothetical protein n=1 Tax=Rhizobium meliloti TaxID=382 RepID=UPI00299EF2D1|nr:hypothetical protein [Sinorhizobium meliloti]MDW9924022.1 hypothetical protein [Sinorhizobium meliloti]MDX0035148.1 hypothetical protein [Sinorhizobium meliloti]